MSPAGEGPGADRRGQPFTGNARETPIAQDLNKVGYFIVTVDGANVTVDYYSAPVSNPTLARNRTASTLIATHAEAQLRQAKRRSATA